jgi:menaquinone-dependent protoporphyrinogen IX oxidase
MNSALAAFIGLVLAIVLVIKKVSPVYSLMLGALTGGLLSGVGLVETVNQMLSGVKDITPYDAVVTGSAIHNKMWLPEAIQFLRVHQAELAQKPFANFSVCITLAMKEGDYRSVVAEWLQPVRDLVKPVSEGLFAGALDISKVPTLGDRLKFRASVALGIWDEGDHRDWTEIHAWANSLATKL